MKLLIVDDDVLLGKAAVRAMKACGWEVEFSSVPKLDMTNKPDVVLADWQPGGPEQVRFCQEAEVPVVIYTAMPNEVPAHLPVVAKPYRIEQLDEKLKTAYEAGRKTQ